MAAITAKMVADLRQKTGVGMMECKKALTEANGDFDAAMKLLREKGLSVAAKKADRIAADGIVDIMTENGKVAMVEINTETDFVAKNETFIAFVKDILSTILAENPANVDELLTKTIANGTATVLEALNEKIFTIGEKISIRRFVIVEGLTSTYIHGKGSIGVIVKLQAACECVATNEKFVECAKNVALQLGAYPTQYLDSASVPASVIAEEKEVLMQQIKNDPKMANKPEAIIEKMVVGRLDKFYEQNCLMHQGYVKDDDMTVAQYVASVAKEIGTEFKVVGFERFEKGEGIEKKVDNLDEEVAKLINKK